MTIGRTCASANPQGDENGDPHRRAAEGLRYGYSDEWITVITEDATHRALAYVATDKRAGLPVFDWYLEHVLRGATENGLPAGYVELLRRVPTVVDGDRGRAANERAIYADIDPTKL